MCCVKMPFSYPLPLRGTLPILGREYKCLLFNSSPKIGEVAAKQTEEYEGV